jgi:lipopolysaccharide transport system permease protein
MAWIALPILLLIQLLWIAACGLMTAAVVPFAPDFKFVIGNGLTLMFFMSGVFFDIGERAPQVQFYFHLNPMATLIESYRDVLLHAAWPNWAALSITLVMSLLLSVAGMCLVLRFDRIYPKLVIS